MLFFLRMFIRGKEQPLFKGDGDGLYSAKLLHYIEIIMR